VGATLTRRGWAVVGAAVAFVAAGRLLGIPELFALAVVAIALVAGALMYVRYTQWDLDATREVRPPAVHAGTNGRVELSVCNRAARRSPVLSARDPFDDGRRWARFHIAPLQPGERVRAAYRLPTAQRGIFPLGPLTIGLTDPCGLAACAREAAPCATLVVYPRVETIHPLGQGRGADPTASSGQPSVAFGGEDFYALRPYQTGDDLRRVHWPSSARSDELMIRQDELPWQGRISVLVDVRRSQHSEASLELALSAAASIVTAAFRAGRQIRLVTSDGVDTGFGTGQAQLTTVLGRLAGMRAGAGTSISFGLSMLDRGGTTGGVAVVTTDVASEDDGAAMGRLLGRFGSAALVVIERSAWDPAAAGQPGPAPGTGRGTAMGGGARRGRVVRVGAGRPFPAVWNATVGQPTASLFRADGGGPAMPPPTGTGGADTSVIGGTWSRR
jgi:uncharacterized protein (DUF58 family)